MTLQLRYAARSHAGLLRSMNEDSVYAGPRLLAVADGMGGHAAGEVASAVAIASVAALDEDTPGADLLEALRRSAEAANDHIGQMASADPELDGMGTTLVALLFAGNRLGLLHIGDSRCYLLRDGELTQITHDHTYVQALVDEGRITEAEADAHPQRSVITNVLDGRSGVEPDLSVREARAGDRYLVCSDGLTGPVNSLDTLQAALEIADPQNAADRLVQLALRGGGPDNVTVVVADVVDTDPGNGTPVVAGAAAEAPQEAPPGISDSAASRARVAEGRDVPTPTRAVAPRPSRRPRTGLMLAVLLLVVLAGGVATWGYVGSQYYVGLDDDQVVVYRGVKGSVAGVDLARVHDRTALHTDRLTQLERDRLDSGIVAHDESDARAIVQRLIARVCPSPAPAATPRPAASPAPPAPTPSPTPCP